eukprot:TRINITY_DN4291_c0_g1_i3.p1 TRINITY_DN4291_c0_g1~~TRINITY_DN4291_c0_g1_i3.p1  ORF type:complete len:317 (+),score=42.97 TRINITY_DN4291_c0_g1_i3:78-1028(+)
MKQKNNGRKNSSPGPQAIAVVKLEDTPAVLPEKDDTGNCSRVADLRGRRQELGMRLMVAVGIDQNPEMCIKLIKEGSPCNIIDSEGDSPLHHAIVAPAFHTVRGLSVISFLATKPVLQEAPHALQLAMFSGRVKAASLLLSLNAPITGAEIVAVASQVSEEDDKESFETTEGISILKKILTRCPEAVHEEDDHGDTPLHLALKNGKPKIALCLLNNGASHTQPDPKGCLPIHNTMCLEETPASASILSALLTKETCNSADEEGDTPLHWAALFERPKAAKAILDFGCNKYLKNKAGETPLDLAKSKQSHGVMKLLL